MAKASSASHFGLLVGGGAALLLAVYFLLPVVFMIPLNAARERDYVSYPFFTACFEPVYFLADRLPAYQHMVAAECDFCQAHGFKVFPTTMLD